MLCNCQHRSLEQLLDPVLRWLGIELDEANGRHDGTVHGIR